MENELQEILEKNWSELAALHRRDLLWKDRHDALLKYYQELRQLYCNATGISYVPDELVRNRIAPSEEDKAWLRSIGIDGI